MNKIKICKKCNIEKTVDLFFKSKTGLFGVKSQCKECCKEQRTNRNKNLEINRIEIENKTCRNCYINYNINNFFRSKLSSDGFEHRCKSCVKKIKNISVKSDYDKRYRLKNSKKIKEYRSNYYYNNKEKAKKYHNNRYHSDPKFNLICKLRNRIGQSIRNNSTNCKKYDSTIKLLGCSFNHYKNYIESKFTKNMTWEHVLNSEIHIDHIKPCSSFDLFDIEQQKICFHYTNLQPLWKEENLKKSNKLDYYDQRELV